jgi:FkbM family methyltransferase
MKKFIKNRKKIIEQFVKNKKYLGLLGGIEEEINGKKVNKYLLKMIQSELELLKGKINLAILNGLIVDATQFENKNDLRNLIRRNSFSQLHQDIWVMENLNYKKNGYFVEFGAADGVLNSNTYALEKFFDWTGICIEANPILYKKLKKNRKCNIDFECISDTSTGYSEIIVADEYSSIKDVMMNDSHAGKRISYLESNKSVRIKNISLNDVLIKYNSPKEIDYMSIDVEGAEYLVLKNFPFADWKIKLLTIEHNFAESRDDITNLMKSYGYSRIEKDWDDWYILNEQN